MTTDLFPVKKRVRKSGKPNLTISRNENQIGFRTAFAQYMNGESVENIARCANTSIQQVKCWIRDNNWMDQRNEILNLAAGDVKDKVRTMISQNILQVAERQLATSAKLDEHIDKHLDTSKKVGTKALADLARAAVSSASIASKIVGLDSATSEATKKPLAVQFNIQVNTSGRSQNQTVHVDVAEQTAQALSISETSIDPEIPEEFF